MIKTIFSTGDGTLYQGNELANTSMDEILQISKHISSSFGPLARSRAVMKFPTTPTSASMAAQGITTSAAAGNLKYFLKLFISEERDIQREHTVVVHPLTLPFEAGTGRSTHNPVTANGVSWKYYYNNQNNKTDTFAVPIAPEYTSTFGTNSVWSNPGGSFLSGAHVSESAIQTFIDTQGDIELDLTAMVENNKSHSWDTITTSIILKRSGSEETDSNVYGDLDYYARNTNTIYSPRIEVRYDNASHAFTTTNGAQLTIANEADVQPRLSPTYKQNSQERIYIDTTLKGGARSQAGSVGTTYSHYLPQSSSYAIIDNATGEYVYKHDATYTYVGRTGATENYIDVDMNGLFPERYYALEFKVNHYTGTTLTATRYYKSNTLFKVVK